MDDDTTHAGHPCTPTRWCVSETCNAAALALQAAAAGEEDE